MHQLLWQRTYPLIQQQKNRYCASIIILAGVLQPSFSISKRWDDIFLITDENQRSFKAESGCKALLK